MDLAQWVSQVALPVCLALMMFAMGISLTVKDFTRVIKHPKAFGLGVGLQFLVLPLLAWLLIWLFGMFVSVPLIVASGLIILAACPGGATSNIISHLAGGNGALSISMTAIVSLLTPFILPVTLAFQLALLNDSQDTPLSLPVAKTLMQLIVVTVIPVVIAMTLRAKFPKWAQRNEKRISKASTILFLLMVLSLTAVNWNKLFDSGWLVAAMCLSLSVIAMLVSYWVSNQAKLEDSNQLTLMIETSVQNAGTGMFIALALLQSPPLATVPLMYGLLMNIPAITLILYGRMRTPSMATS
ncbi:putative Bile acid:sodium symporter [Vibrio nigripulchritudo SO65]|uniref:bile acid:sodium symporter family protein n=1 Tax=Vibrio nigripulchritudo TaxID=28173 RepID=UPI0003B2339D|nr:bile acid:sodium symporter [Vibrio nigripulchritudo]CCN37299.1 putative Bile acid:sodium symporter [Vibrio nigripulchritudo AM115]CCN41378.1 putative Bile acid:sodium symporter [Vibrio nigripulchritudo FTn2]CCN64741.1 putative Bile acid:sodium symporter [Vibrio nigripulchritudo POn4]CCN76843.1 putative Bile acid:sodium symporter [Vibrio nigripulchritudo SO65]